MRSASGGFEPLRDWFKALYEVLLSARVAICGSAIWTATAMLDSLSAKSNTMAPRIRNSELSCLTAVTLDGRVLWQIGEPDRGNST